MKNLVIIFGGDSVEHDISVLTALHAARNVTDDFHIVLVYLTRRGEMVTSGGLGRLSKVQNYITGRALKGCKCFFSGGVLYRKSLFGIRKVCTPSAVLNCCHGGVGEDGRLAAMLDVFDVPVTSSGYVAASNIQSKSATRSILTAAGFDQPKYIAIKRGDSIDEASKNAVETVGFPMIIKPNNLGSSIGISVAKNEQEFTDALKLVFELDAEAVAEQYLDDITEINCSAFRAGGKLRVSKCELIDNDKPILDFSAKYLDSGSGFIKKGKNGEDTVIDEEKQIQQLTEKAYELFDARGVIRADFMISGGRIYLNEINSVPGFLCYHLWLRSGLPYGTLISMLVNQARFDARNFRKTEFKSEILLKNKALVE